MNTNQMAAAGVMFVSSLVLSACGGGGSDSPAVARPAAGSNAQGVYTGTLSSGYEHNTLILENNQFYTIYGKNTAGIFSVAGLAQGDGQISAGSFTSSNLKDYENTGAVQSGSLRATYSPSTSFNGTVTEGANNILFTGEALNASIYNYNSAANLATISGAWNLVTVQGEYVALNIGDGGAFTGTSGGCAFSGNFTPRASGKNVFDFALKFGTTSCALPGQSTSGIALTLLVANGKRQFIMAGSNSSRENGSAMIGIR